MVPSFAEGPLGSEGSGRFATSFIIFTSGGGAADGSTHEILGLDSLDPRTPQ